MIETAVIKMPSRKMFAVLLMKNAIPWILIAFAGMAALIFLGAILDYRFFILALIWIFMVMPMCMAFLYFFYGMKQLTAFNSIPHKLSFDPDNIKISFQKISAEAFKDSHAEEKGDKSQDMKEPEFDREIVISGKDLEKIEGGGDYVLLYFKPQSQGWLWVPLSAFSTYDDFLEALIIISPEKIGNLK